MLGPFDKTLEFYAESRYDKRQNLPVKKERIFLAALILLGTVLVLVLSYVLFGRSLEKAWGLDPKAETPAYDKFDRKDYVSAAPGILLGHHVASIAGALVVFAPVLAAKTGWLPALLWCVLGGVVFGAVLDFGSLVASLRQEGKSLGEVLRRYVSPRAQKLYIVHALVVLVLFVAFLTAVAANSFASAGGIVTLGEVQVSAGAASGTTAILFVLLALLFSFLVYRKNLPMGAMIALGVVGIALCVLGGMNFGLNLPAFVWVALIAVYAIVASQLPVWTLLQSRDFLSSILLGGMLLLGAVSVVVASLGGHAQLTVPALAADWTDGNWSSALVLVLAGTGASGFHALVASGTSAKQLGNEKHAKLIGFGGMLLTVLVSVLALLAAATLPEGFDAANPAQGFAAGLATLFSIMLGGDGTAVASGVVYELWILTVTVFAMTSLDTAVRLGRYLLVELFNPEGLRKKEMTPLQKTMTRPLTGALVVAVSGCALGLLPRMGQMLPSLAAADLLLAAVCLMAVAVWLDGRGLKSGAVRVLAVVLLVVAIVDQVLTGVSLGGDVLALVCELLPGGLGLVIAGAILPALFRKPKPAGDTAEEE